MSLTSDRQPPPDLTDLRGFHDWFGSVQEVETWEALMNECEAKRQAPENHESLPHA
jgi:hypothetical protein